MMVGQCLHVLTNLVDSGSQVQPCECEVLKPSDKAAAGRGVIERITFRP